MEFMPKELVQKVLDKNLTRCDLDNFEFTELLRTAYILSLSGNSFLEKKILKWLNLRPLPICAYLNTSNQKIECKLFPHQIEVLKFMKKREESNKDDLFGIQGGIVAITMGLGKTLIAITHSVITPSFPNNSGYTPPTLIVSSKTLLGEWKTNFEKFFGKRLSVLFLHPDFSQKSFYETLTERSISDYDFVVTTYDTCKIAFKKRRLLENLKYVDHTTSDGENTSLGIFTLYSLEWERIFCDESQIFANDSTMVYKSMVALQSRRGKWCLSGTIVRNSLSDVWSQLVFCGFNHPNAKTAEEWERNYDMILEHHPIIDQAICRMTNESVKIELPPRHDIIDTLPMSKSMSYLVDLLTKETVKSIRQTQMGIGKNTSSSLAMLSKLRQLSIAPHLLHPSSKRKHKNVRANPIVQNILDEFGDWLSDRNGKAGILSPKIKYVTDKVAECIEDEKVIVFSMFTSALDLVSYALDKLRNIHRYSSNTLLDDEETYFVQIDGSVVGQERFNLIETFKTIPNVRVMLINFRVGAEGLNLTVSNKTIFLDGCWNPCITEQAASRTHRVGQTKEVYVYRPIMDNIVEKNMLEICKRKDIIIRDIMNRDLTKKDSLLSIDVSTIAEIFGIN